MPRFPATGPQSSSLNSAWQSVQCNLNGEESGEKRTRLGERDCGPSHSSFSFFLVANDREERKRHCAPCCSRSPWGPLPAAGIWPTRQGFLRSRVCRDRHHKTQYNDKARPQTHRKRKERHRDPRTRGSTNHAPTLSSLLRFATTICIPAPERTVLAGRDPTNRPVTSSASRSCPSPPRPGMRTLQHASSNGHPVSGTCPLELKVEPTPTSQRRCWLAADLGLGGEGAQKWAGPCPTANSMTFPMAVLCSRRGPRKWESSVAES